MAKNSIIIDESGEVSIQLMNNKKQLTSLESRTFEKITKPHKAVKVKNPEEGLIFNYYEGTWDRWPDFNQLKAKSNGVVHDFSVSDFALRVDHFGMVLTGTILIEEDGLYIFRSSSKDACKLYIHDELVLNEDNADEDSRDVGAIALKKGFHPLTIHFRDDVGNEYLRLYFKKTYDHQWEQLKVKGRFYH